MSKTPRADIAHAIVQQLSQAADASQVAQEIAAFLISEGREADLESIMRDVMRIQREHGTLEVDVQSARELDDTLLAEIAELVRQEFPAATRVVTSETVLPELVGGVRVVTADEQLDLSVRGKLDTFKRLTHGGNI
ncbi:hypothetical protein E6P97_03380 [Patescibacteria group bacterium]|nr:MAG: hypothetical protein E6P97_03380 [Patescibacteria group bacterium]